MASRMQSKQRTRAKLVPLSHDDGQRSKHRLSARPVEHYYGELPLASRRQWHVFETDLGWMAALGHAGLLEQLVIGCDSPAAAVAHLPADALSTATEARWCAELVRMLRAYARGKPIDFTRVPIGWGEVTPFQLGVFKACRQIPHGQTASYGELALAAGYPRASRAVGNVMASNRAPLVVPCHRVIHADGRLGRYSAPQGPTLKTRLLKLERSA
jgi:methylated-DNA-[protein]-cysteine S-methyltransferase